MTNDEAQLEVGRLLRWLATEANLADIETNGKSPVDVACALLARRGAWSEERAASVMARIARATELLFPEDLDERDSSKLDHVESAVLRALRDARKWRDHLKSCRRER